MTTDTGTTTKTDGAATTSTSRDPRVDPQPGDRLERQLKSCVRTRTVVERKGFDVYYTEDVGSQKRKNCWISTWMEWAREARVVRDPGDIFAMTKAEAGKLLSGLEIEGTLTRYLKERYPKYIDANGEAMKFTLATDLGLIET
jgi:hypothetical protein